MPDASFLAWVGVVVLVFTAVGLITQWVVKPFVRAMRGLADIAEALPVLMDIADKFRPNEGHSLSERLTLMESSIASIVASQTQLHAQLVALNENTARSG